MDAEKIDSKKAAEEKSQAEKEKLEQEAYEEAMKEFRLSAAYPYIIKSVDEKIQSVTDTRQLAISFGKIKSEIIGEMGTLGTASLMASKPLEEIRGELTGELE